MLHQADREAVGADRIPAPREMTKDEVIGDEVIGNGHAVPRR
jgi:hypothetical protein